MPQLSRHCGRKKTAPVQSVLASLSPDEAHSLLPNRHTGFVKGNHRMYDVIEEAGLAVGRTKAQAQGAACCH